MAKTLIEDKNYVYRSTACWVLAYSTECLDKKEFNDLLCLMSNFFINLVGKLADEKVANVLICFFSEYPKYRNIVNAKNKEEMQGLLRKVREEKEDEYVLYLLSKL